MRGGLISQPSPHLACADLLVSSACFGLAHTSSPSPASTASTALRLAHHHCLHCKAMATSVYAPMRQYAGSMSSYPSESTLVAAAGSQEEYLSTFFCRALYDYQSTDDSSLSFRKGDIIEVLTRLDSGWWDGLLGDERGWFPSNYVLVLSDEEADIAFATSELHQAQQAGINDEHAATMMQSISSSNVSATSSGMRDDGANWLESDVGFGLERNAMDELASVGMDGPVQSNDFWVPQVTSDGQVRLLSHF
jgi:son of sevenless